MHLNLLLEFFINNSKIFSVVSCDFLPICFVCIYRYRMAYHNIFEFTCAVRGFHHYRRHWHPEPDQILNCYHERYNPFDRFIIKFCKAGKEETIGHIPMEISRVTKYFMDRGATVAAQLTGVRYQRSPLKQGGWIRNSL